MYQAVACKASVHCHADTIAETDPLLNQSDQLVHHSGVLNGDAVEEIDFIFDQRNTFCGDYVSSG